jgi:hypothetical protein
MVQAQQFSWFSRLDQDQQDLIKLSEFLYQRESMSEAVLSDYAFIVFPIAKAYEGFLKQYLFDLELIDQKTFESHRFRIGRALNADIREGQQDEFWLYDNIERLCGNELARELWNTWIQCRNQVVHYFPLDTHSLSLQQAGKRVEMVLQTMDAAYRCALELKKT